MFKKTNYFYFFSIFVILLMNSCSDTDNSYYRINKVRVVASLFQNSTVFPSGITSNTSTQQFPLRLTNSSTSCATTHFYIVAISPTSETPTITINGIVLFAIGGNYLSGGAGACGVSAGTTGTNIASSFFFSSSTSTAIQTTPFRVTLFDYTVNCSNLTETNLTSYMNQVGDIPGFQLSYTVNTGSSSDQGFYSFYFLPDPTASWWSSTSFPSAVSSSKKTSIQNGLAVTNNPIQISSISPTGSTISGGNDNSINANITIPSIPSPRDSSNSIFSAKSRVQWYVTSGNLNLDTSASTTWNPSVGSGNSAGGFVIVRDLLGGVDFKILGPFTTQ